MQFILSKVTGRLLAAFHPAKNKSTYTDVTTMILPSGTVVQLYTMTEEDEYLIQIDSHMIVN